MNIRPFLTRHPALAYFTIAFLISWGGVLILSIPYGMPATPDQAETAWPIVFMPYFLGPVIASLVMVGLVSGRGGFGTLRTRLVKWKVGVGWYAGAVLTAPILVGLLSLLLSLFSKDFLPIVATAEDKVGVVIQGIAVGLIFGGFLEELGWTGFAVPTLRRRHSVLATGLIVGFLHALWHVLPTYWATGDASGAVSLRDFIPPMFFYAGVLPAYRVLMVWVYDQTQSLLVCMLMHASLTASAPWILMPVATGTPLVVYYLILTAVMWAVVGLVARSNGQRFRSGVGHA